MNDDTRVLVQEARLCQRVISDPLMAISVYSWFYTSAFISTSVHLPILIIYFVLFPLPTREKTKFNKRFLRDVRRMIRNYFDVDLYIAELYDKTAKVMHDLAAKPYKAAIDG